MDAQTVDTEEVWRDYAAGSLRILAASLRRFEQGARENYRVVAVQLRLLLCDTNRIHERLVDVSLIPRLLPDCRLRPLQISPRVRVDPSAEPVPLQTWLAGTVPLPGGAEITLRELIRIVCEQDGGAHVDPRHNHPVLVWDGRAEAIAAAGESVLRDLLEALAFSG